MTLAECIITCGMTAVLAAATSHAIGAAKRHITGTASNIWVQHNERIDYLSSGVVEDPAAHHSTEKDVSDSTHYFSTIQFTRDCGSH